MSQVEQPKQEGQEQQQEKAQHSLSKSSKIDQKQQPQNSESQKQNDQPQQKEQQQDTNQVEKENITTENKEQQSDQKNKDQNDQVSNKDSQQQQKSLQQSQQSQQDKQSEEKQQEIKSPQSQSQNQQQQQQQQDSPKSKVSQQKSPKNSESLQKSDPKQQDKQSEQLQNSQNNQDQQQQQQSFQEEEQILLDSQANNQDDIQEEDENHTALKLQIEELEAEIEGKNEEQIMKIRQRQLALAKYIVNIYESDELGLVIAHTQLGEAYLNYQCLEQAIDHLSIGLFQIQEKGLFRKDQDSKTWNTRILKQLGVCYSEIGNKDESIQILIKAEQMYQNMYKHLDYMTIESFDQYIYEKREQDRLDQEVQEMERQRDNKISERDEQKTEEELENEQKLERERIEKFREERRQYKEQLKEIEKREQENLTAEDKEASVNFSDILQLIATEYFEQTRWDEAEAYNLRVQYICNKVGDIGNYSKAKAGIQLAQIYESEDILRAIEFQEDAVLDLEQVAEDKEYLCKQYETLAKIYQKFKLEQRQQFGDKVELNIDDDLELIYYKKMEQIYEGLEDKTNKKVLKIKRYIGLIYKEYRQYQLATEEYKKILDIQIDLFGENSLQVGQTLQILGKIFEEQDQLEDAKYYYNSALKIFDSINQREASKRLREKLRNLNKQ